MDGMWAGGKERRVTALMHLAWVAGLTEVSVTKMRKMERGCC